MGNDVYKTPDMLATEIIIALIGGKALIMEEEDDEKRIKGIAKLWLYLRRTINDKKLPEEA